MNSLYAISVVSWVGMWFAFHLGHPLGYVIPIIGLAAAIAIAHEAPSPQEEADASEPAPAPRRLARRRVAAARLGNSAVAAPEQRRAA